MVRVHLLGSQHVTTLERALEESRIFANAHRGHDVRATCRVDHYDDHMDLTFHSGHLWAGPLPLARFNQEPVTSASHSV